MVTGGHSSTRGRALAFVFISCRPLGRLLRPSGVMRFRDSRDRPVFKSVLYALELRASPLTQKAVLAVRGAIPGRTCIKSATMVCAIILYCHRCGMYTAELGRRYRRGTVYK